MKKTLLVLLVAALASMNGYAAASAKGQVQIDAAAKKLGAEPAGSAAINAYMSACIRHFGSIMKSDRAGAEKLLDSMTETLAAVEAKDDAAKQLLPRARNAVPAYRSRLKMAHTPMAEIIAELRETPGDVSSIRNYRSKVIEDLRPVLSSDPVKAQAKLDKARSLIRELQKEVTEERALKELAAAHSYFARLDKTVDSAKKRISMVGKTAAPLEIEDWANGTPLSGKDLEGKVVLLDFWAVWCGPCIATFPHLREWHDEYADRGLVIVGLTRYYNYTWDEKKKRASKSKEKVTPEQEREMLGRFAAEHDLKHRFAIASNRELSKFYHVSGIPHVVLIDRKGKIRLMRVGSGEDNAKAVGAMIAKLIKEEG